MANKEQLKEIQPTVFIGLGGTGMEVLLRLRRRILLHRWNQVRLKNLAEFPIAQFMYFDLDTKEAREAYQVSMDLLGSGVRFQPGETLQEKLDVHRFFDNKSAYPLIQEWFPSTQQMDQIDPTNGAGQIRALARLQFFQKASDFRQMLQTKARAAIASLDDEEHLASLGLETERGGYRVFIVGSSAGGTGSGSFLDAGFLARSLDDPAAQDVSMILMLCSAFSEANATRVQANTYAALKELEFCMNRSHQPRYVERWQELGKPIPSDFAPFNDVYLVDSANLGRERTERRENIFDMVSDILFEDFRNSDFSKHKRSVASNTQQHKAYRYFPPLPPSLHKTLSYSLGYSSFGQAIIETNAGRLFDRRNYETVRNLVMSFYNLDAERQENPVKEEHLNAFLEKELFLTAEGFRFLQDQRLQKFFHRPPENLPPTVRTYGLVIKALVRPDGIPLFKAVSERIESGMDEVRGHADFTQWNARIVDLQNTLEQELIGLPGITRQSPRNREIGEATHRIWETWVAEDNGLSAKIYSLVEDHEKGGILYALDLMQRVKERLGNATTGVIGHLTEARDEFRRWAAQMLSALHKVPLENLKQLRGRRAIDRGEIILSEGVKPLLENYALFQLHALACDQLINRLDELSNGFLGKQEGYLGNNEPIWTGLIGGIDEGRRRLVALIGEVTREIAIIDSNRNTPMRWCLDDGYLLKEPPSRTELLSIAQEVIKTTYRGSRTLFDKLRSSEGKLEVMNNVRQLLHERLFEAEEKELPSIHQVLSAQGAKAQQEIKKLVDRALPWIDADTGRMATFSADLYKMFVAVANKGNFEQAFASHLRSAVPHGITPAVVESGERGRLVCYCELSGIPLNVLIPLKTSWATSYRAERLKMPLHNHWDTIRYPDPVVPTEVDILRQSDLVATYLKGIVFNLLKRGSEPERGETDKRKNHYFLEKGTGAWSSLGVEQAVLSGERDDIMLQVRGAVAAKEGALGPEQYAALSALFYFYAESVYPPYIVTDPKKGDQESFNLQHAVALNLAQEYLERYRRQSDVNGQQARDLRKKLLDHLGKWTHEIPESKNDLNEGEVDVFSARPKRAITEANFKIETLRGILSGHSGVPTDTPTAVQPPPLRKANYWIAVKGKEQSYGPFSLTELRHKAQNGDFMAEHLVWKEGMEDWMVAREVSDVKGLFSVAVKPPPVPK